MYRIEQLSAAVQSYGALEEPWKLRHDEVAACHKLEERIVYGNHLFDSIQSLEATWTEQVSTGATPFDAKQAAMLDRTWQMWLTPCDRLESAIQTFEAKSYEVEPAAGFRDRCRRARIRAERNLAGASWRLAVRDSEVRMFSRPTLTEEDLRLKSGPFPDRE